MASNSLSDSLIKETEVNRDEEPPSSVKPYHINRHKLIDSLLHSNRVKSTLDFRKEYLPGVIDSEWNDWHWQIRNSFRYYSQLEKFFHVKLNITHEQGNKDSLPLRITPYYASLIDFSNPNDPLFKAVVPSTEEFKIFEGESSDPLHENDCSPVHNLVHRYPDRVLFLATGFCSTYCRYCTRSHMVAKKEKSHFSTHDLEPAFKYIEDHPEIRDVLMSGGDPFTLPEERLEYILKRLRAIPHVEIIRIGTKVPAVLPQRITLKFTDMLKKYHPLFVSIHFTHPNELTPEVQEATAMLANAGIPLGSQTVLLKGINDDVEVMRKLMTGLLKFRVRPYYLYQCDPILGSGHFRTTVQKGLEIIKGLRGFTSGYAIPTYVIDAPGGGGKIPLLPNYVASHGKNGLKLKNYEGKTYLYPDYTE
ncbi:MAG: lysine 2,3-aminomutase [Bacteroidetes bacterium GWF2_38_335]|nr:MAG: lysine 2,3-aminomutase [Bacteroidetes bacterium GWF2_38_335]HBS88229.1 lysine 2,3-aminomutase [Bacteroidales bacterium]